MKRYFFAAIFLIVCAAVHAQPSVLINEVASEEPTPPGDWIEFYVSSFTDLSGWKVFEQNALVKTFPSLSLSAGTYFILKFNSSSPDETPASGDANGNGILDLYTADTGLTGTSNAVSLRDAKGLVMDAVVFSDSASWTSAQQSAFDMLVSTGQWQGTVNGGLKNFSDSVNIAGGVGPGNSIGRNPDALDTNHFSDWRHIKGTQTKGSQNPASVACPNSPPFEGTISEVAPSLPISAGGDFVEIFVNNPINVCGSKIYEGAGLIKTLPSVTPNAGPFGSYIILHAGAKISPSNPDETDVTGDMNGNGSVDLYSDESSPGITGSADNAILLESSDGNLIDFMGFSDKLLFYSAVLQGQYNRAVSQGLWVPECSGEEDCYGAGSVAWSNSTTKSISKKISEGGFPMSSRPSSPDDWEISAPTPGKTSRTAKQETAPAKNAIRVSQSPFSPIGDGPFREALFDCPSDPGSKITLKLYDVQGRLIRTIADRVSADDAQVFSWDGRNAGGDLVPVGIYVVWFEIKQSNGELSHNAETVVVGRQL